MESLPEIRTLSQRKPAEYLMQLEEMLRELGIVLVCIPGFPHTGIQGAAQWIDKDKAMIILKTDGQAQNTPMGEDKFWFNLFHELGHLVLHSKKQTFVDLEDDPQSEQEREADDFAVTHLLRDFNESELDQYRSARGIDGSQAVRGISKRLGISHSIVAGHLAYLYKERQPQVYAILCGHIGKISYTNV